MTNLTLNMVNYEKGRSLIGNNCIFNRCCTLFYHYHYFISQFFTYWNPGTAIVFQLKL